MVFRGGLAVICPPVLMICAGFRSAPREVSDQSNSLKSGHPHHVASHPSVQNLNLSTVTLGARPCGPSSCSHWSNVDVVSENLDRVVVPSCPAPKL